MKQCTLLLLVFFCVACFPGLPTATAADETLYFEIRWNSRTRADLQKAQNEKKSLDGVQLKEVDYSEEINALKALEVSFSSLKGCEIAEGNKTRRVVLTVDFTSHGELKPGDEPMVSVHYQRVGISAPGSDSVLMMSGGSPLTPKGAWPISKLATGAGFEEVLLTTMVRALFIEWKSQSYDELDKLMTPSGLEKLKPHIERMVKEYKEQRNAETNTVPKPKPTSEK